MAWFRVDDGFHDHPKVDDLSLEAIGLWLLCATWSSRHLTDGEIPFSRVVKLGGNRELCSELVRANMWRTSENVRDEGETNTYFFVNWDDWNPTKEDVQNERKKARQRMQKLRSKRTDQEERSPEQSPNEQRTSPFVRNPVPSRPVPIRERRKTSLPPDWKPTDTHAQKCAQLGIDMNWEATKFKDNAEAKGLKYVNWDKAFHTWLNRSKDFQPKHRGGDDLWSRTGNF